MQLTRTNAVFSRVFCMFVSVQERVKIEVFQKILRKFQKFLFIGRLQKPEAHPEEGYQEPGRPGGAPTLLAAPPGRLGDGPHLWCPPLTLIFTPDEETPGGSISSSFLSWNRRHLCSSSGELTCRLFPASGEGRSSPSSSPFSSSSPLHHPSCFPHACVSNPLL